MNQLIPPIGTDLGDYYFTSDGSAVKWKNYPGKDAMKEHVFYTNIARAQIYQQDRGKTSVCSVLVFTKVGRKYIEERYSECKIVYHLMRIPLSALHNTRHYKKNYFLPDVNSNSTSNKENGHTGISWTSPT